MDQFSTLCLNIVIWFATLCWDHRVFLLKVGKSIDETWEQIEGVYYNALEFILFSMSGWEDLLLAILLW